MRFHQDARRRFWGDIFATEFGDINVVRLNPGVTIAWHRHQYQDDRLHVIAGDLCLQMIDREGTRHRWDLEASDDLLPYWIQRGCWHGYSSREGATILQFNGPRKWDGTDEERHPIGEAPWNW